MRKINDWVTRYAFQPVQLDELDDPVDRWSDTGEPVGIYEFDPGGSTVPEIPGHDRVVTTPTLYLPYGCPLRRHDKVEIDGDTYRVVADPAKWKQRRTGRQVGDVVQLKQVVG